MKTKTTEISPEVPNAAPLQCPKTGEGWTIAAIEELIAKRANENGDFDFKEQLPHSKNDGDKLRNRNVFCSFANTCGGFIIFGVKDNPKSAADIIGINDSEFLKVLNDQLLDCVPPIDWKSYPLTSPVTGDPVHVIAIRPSKNLHHSKAQAKDGVFTFYKRTDGGSTEKMSYEEIRQSFLERGPTTQKLKKKDVALFNSINKSLSHNIASQFHNRHFGDTIDGRFIDPLTDILNTATDQARRFIDKDLEQCLVELVQAADIWEGIYFKYAYALDRDREAFKLLQDHEWPKSVDRVTIVEQLRVLGNEIFNAKSKLVKTFKEKTAD